MKEIDRKLRRLREKMAREKIGAVRLRGVDWFAWATGGGDSAVLFAEEAGVAEVLVSDSGAWILTNRIEAERIRADEAGGFEVMEFPWESSTAREAFVRGKAKVVASDYPKGEETPLPPGFLELRLQLEPEEVERYRWLGADAAGAMARALREVNGSSTEWDLAGATARELWKLGIHPLLTMAAGERRVVDYRHPISKDERLGTRAMIVVCGRREGLYANVTRHVFWRPLHEHEQKAQEDVLTVEAAAFAGTAEGLSLPDCYARMAETYARLGVPNEIHRHHQGGSTGYRAREEVASPESPSYARKDGVRAYAWNPSLPGAKVEDTILRHPDGKLEIISVDGAWPVREFGKQRRPEPLVLF